MIREGITIVTPPAFYPVTLEGAKDHLNVTHGTDDAYIAELIRAAAEWCEARQGLAYVETVYRQTLDELCGMIRLLRWPIVSVDSIKYDDADGIEQTLAASKYRLGAHRAPAIIEAAWNESWPATRAQTGAVRVTFTAGFASADRAPRKVRQAMLLLIEAWYGERRGYVTGTIVTELPGPSGIEALLSPDAVNWV